MRVFILIVLCAIQVHAQSSYEFLSFDLPKEPQRERALFWPQLGSLLLPGLDQIIEEQWSSGVTYAGVALAGANLSVAAAQRLEARGITPDSDYWNNLDSRDNDVRNIMLGSHIYQTMGYFSAYHSFRSAVRTHQASGRYSFLATEESMKDLALAPFDFKHLKKPRVWIPLALVGGILGSYFKSNDFKNNNYKGEDLVYSASFSYGAGVGEEMVFRGWMMPEFYQAWGSEFWSNFATSTLFAAAHLSPSNHTPWPQFVLGYYFGYQTQANNWTLSESIFLHTWWDVVVFSLAYFDSSIRERAVLRIPLLYIQF